MSDQVVVYDGEGYPVTPDLVRAAYRDRCFPMAEARGETLRWFRPAVRAIITWDSFRVPRSLAKRWRQKPYRLYVNRDVPAVIAACADRSETWISYDIERLYCALAEQGHVHAIAAYDENDRLVGGVYGLASDGCFCGESMFHRATDAAKLSVIALVSLLRQANFGLLDCQQQTPHMERLGAFEVADEAYADALQVAPMPAALPQNAQLLCEPDPMSARAVALA